VFACFLDCCRFLPDDAAREQAKAMIGVPVSAFAAEFQRHQGRAHVGARPRSENVQNAGVS
jgi:hypothetical protein